MLDIKASKPLSTDERGTITRLVDLTRTKMRSVLVIHSRAGSVRANHYHIKDIHYTYLLSGKFIYYEKTLKAKTLNKKTITPGQMIISQAGRVHAMKFLNDSVMVVLTTESRDQKIYERDTKRIKII